MGGCASKDKKDKVVDGDANAANATENTADGDKASAATTTEANGDATTNAEEGCVFFNSHLLHSNKHYYHHYYLLLSELFVWVFSI